MGGDNSFTQSVFVYEEKVKRKKESLESVQPWRENSREIWSVLECISSWKFKIQAFNPEEWTLE
jgi:hypothetical protein